MTTAEKRAKLNQVVMDAVATLLQDLEGYCACMPERLGGCAWCKLQYAHYQLKELDK